MTLFAQEPDSWTQMVADLREYVMKPELAAAIENEARMDALYEVLDAFEIASDAAQSIILGARQAQNDYIEASGLSFEEAPSIWDDRMMSRMIGVYIPPADALSSYWTLAGLPDRAETLGVAIEQARANIRSLTKTA